MTAPIYANKFWIQVTGDVSRIVFTDERPPGEYASNALSVEVAHITMTEGNLRALCDLLNTLLS